MRITTAGLIAALALIAGPERRADACGACFGPPGTFTAVSNHRMVIALGVDETVLWDQFIYSGQPQDFAWVLPVPSPDVTVEIASERFVDTLDRETTPQVSPALSECGGGAGCDGFGGGGFDETGSIIVPGVDVVDRSVVGPYDTSTINADDPRAMYTWLQANGYAFPDTAIATLDRYIEGGSSFIALRLAPGEDVTAMQPIRVRFRGFMGTFPLEMVTIGATGELELSLWVISEQRYEAANYPTVAVDQSQLVWDWATDTANYDEVFEAAIQDSGGRAWVVEYAERLGGDLVGPLKEAALEDFNIAATSLPAPYVTRLRTRMLVDHIDQDLQLAPAADARDVPRTLYATRSINAECGGEAAGLIGGLPAGRGLGGLLLVAAAIAVAFGRRRQRLAAVG